MELYYSFDQLLKELSEAKGPSGWEDEVRDIFIRYTGSNAQIDRFGSVYQYIRNSEKTEYNILICAHMDEVGFVVHEILDNGFLRVLPLGNWWVHTLLGQRVQVKTDRNNWVMGVIGAIPPHFLEKGKGEKGITDFSQIFIDVGAESLQDVEERLGIHVGSVVVPWSPFGWLREDRLCMGKAFDDRVGLSLVIELYRQLTRDLSVISPKLGIYLAGTVQEEVGCRGAGVLAERLKPAIAIILECPPADDIPDFPKGSNQGVLGKGVQIRIADPTTLMNREMVELSIQICRENSIPYQVAVRKSGSTDAKTIHLAYIGIPSLVLGIPGRYVHSHVTVIDTEDYLATLQLVCLLCQYLDFGTIQRILHEK